MLIKKEDMLRQKRKFPAIATILRGSSAIATFLDMVANLPKHLQTICAGIWSIANTNEEDASSAQQAVAKDQAGLVLQGRAGRAGPGQAGREVTQ